MGRGCVEGKGYTGEMYTGGKCRKEEGRGNQGGG